MPPAKSEARSRELKIGTIREWQRDIDLRPFEAQRRVFILDDAETLNEAASNAMLKTLEEPPSYAVIILIAHGAGDLMPTIVSRCRVMRCARCRATRYPVAGGALRHRVSDDAALVAAWSGGRIGWAIGATEEPERLEQQQQRLDVLIQLGAASRVARMRWAEERAKEYRGGEHELAVEWMRLWQSWWRDVLLAAQRQCAGDHASGSPAPSWKRCAKAVLAGAGAAISAAARRRARASWPTMLIRSWRSRTSRCMYPRTASPRRVGSRYFWRMHGVDGRARRLGLERVDAVCP